jgi:hypothetical protein
MDRESGGEPDAIEHQPSYSHIVRILAFTSIGARLALAASFLDLVCGQDRPWKYLVTLLGMKRVRCA